MPYFFKGNSFSWFQPSLETTKRQKISSIPPPPRLPPPSLFSLSHCLSSRPPSLPASSSVIPLSPSVVVLNKQQGVVGRGLHSRWVCESPEGGDGRRRDGEEGGSEASLHQTPLLALHQPEVTRSAEETGRVG